jgi:hypothetical protein
MDEKSFYDEEEDSYYNSEDYYKNLALNEEIKYVKETDSSTWWFNQPD